MPSDLEPVPSEWPVDSKKAIVYRALLEMEAIAKNEIPSKETKKALVAADLERMSVLVVGERLAAELASALHGADMPDVISRLAKFYLDRLFRVLRTDTSRTPAESTHPSRGESFDLTKETVRAMLKEPPPNHTKAKLRALERDGYRCVISNRPDMDAFNAAHVRGEPMDGVPLYTECAHIFSASINEDIEKNIGNKDYAASAWAVLVRMGATGVSIFDDLNGEGIHRLQNVMTMGYDYHKAFDTLALWLEPTDQDNTYRVCYSAPSWRALGLAETITFTTPDPLYFPVPSPRFLELHGLCAKVAHLSGAAEYVLNILHDIETGSTAVLASDGQDAHILDMLLTWAQGITAHRD